ncbi:glutathione S-transferase [Sulfitobacter sp. SK011]|uniref:glutathione S-transferase n=1 Tax=Sulfitobacter sp. SK011 TaxID=1389004 RepID=UPI000E0A30E5|nr:glutathione S-transferase [Sulfitobacter sp. SK011]AXI40879.1 glutathione S-transferase [Sulfitobacter sp. SK011]
MTPIFYSFRRCPYAMRARLAIAAAGITVELREVVLRDKPAAFLAASDSGTVPCLVTDQGNIDESLDIMKWALARNDTDHWLDMRDTGWDLIARADGPFKDALDRTKYASRYSDTDAKEQREVAAEFLTELDSRIAVWIFERPSIADFAILPFVRQFAFIDKPWFDAQPWPDLQGWLDRFLATDQFENIMLKYPQWSEGDAPTFFPD